MREAGRLAPELWGGLGRMRRILAAVVLAMTAVVAFAAPAEPAASGSIVAGGVLPGEDLAPLRSTGTEGFPLVDGPRRFEFPRDHGPHPEFRQEWWYLTGNLTGAAGERFGFELTFFRFALRPGPPVDDSPWRSNQLYTAHFAITDVAKDRFRFAQKYARHALGLAGAAAAPFHVWLDDWRVVQPGPAGVGDRTADMAPPAASLGAARPDAPWTLYAHQQGYELELQVQPQSAPILNGDQGFSVKSGERGAASYYYSIPRLAVHGRLVRDGAPIAVNGTAWLDREWGSGSLGANEAGWDWFALQLEDGSALMFYALRNRDGAREPHSAGTWMDSKGNTRALTSEEVRIAVGDHWKSPRGTSYPSRWRLQIPTLSLDVDIKPVMANQELGTRPRYWEGAVDISGSHEGHATSGRGYVELVGY
jgi:predicted secreted hydrolase